MSKYSELLKDPRWQRKRLEVLESDNFTCQWCGERTKTLHVHHFVYRGLPWEIDPGDVATICEDCHWLEHRKETMSSLELELLSKILHGNRFFGLKEPNEAHMKNVAMTIKLVKTYG